MIVAQGKDDVAEVGVHVVHGAAFIAYQMVVLVEIGVEACRSGTEIELGDLAHRRQIVERLVHGAQRDGGHVGSNLGVNALGSEVLGAAMKRFEDPQALRRDLHPAGPEELGQIGR